MKKKLAILLAVLMAFSMVTPVFGTVAWPGNDPSTDYVYGGGDIIYADEPPPILSGIIPTGQLLDFTIDPLGLLSAAQGQVIDLTQRNNEVLFDTPVLRASNSSSVPVFLNVALAVTGLEGITAVTTIGDLGRGTNTNRNVMMWMRPNVDVHHTDSDAFVGYTHVIPFGATAVNALYLLEAVPHELYVYTPAPNLELAWRPEEDAEEQYGTAFSFGGMFNEAANWGAYADPGDPDNLPDPIPPTPLAIGVQAVFTMTEIPADGEDGAYIDGLEDLIDHAVDTPYGLLPPFETVGAGDDYVAPTMVAWSTIIATGVLIPYLPPAAGFFGGNAMAGNFGSATNFIQSNSIGDGINISMRFFADGQDIDSVWISNGGAWTQLPSAHYTLADNMLSIIGWFETAPGQWQIRIVLEDNTDGPAWPTAYVNFQP